MVPSRNPLQGVWENQVMEREMRQRTFNVDGEKITIKTRATFRTGCKWGSDAKLINEEG